MLELIPKFSAINTRPIVRRFICLLWMYNSKIRLIYERHICNVNFYTRGQPFDIWWITIITISPNLTWNSKIIEYSFLSASLNVANIYGVPRYKIFCVKSEWTNTGIYGCLNSYRKFERFRKKKIWLIFYVDSVGSWLECICHTASDYEFLI
jgi:hypothetical protein